MASAERNESLRLDEIGAVARALSEEEVSLVQRVARLIHEGRLPDNGRLALFGAVHVAMRAGTSPERTRAASRVMGPLVDALVQLMVLDARRESSRRKIHDALRALELPSLDALEDLLARYDSVRPIVEAERMYRAGLLDGDWRIVLAPDLPVPAGRIGARVAVCLRVPDGQAS